MLDIFKLGLKRPIEENDIYEALPEHQSSKLSEKFTKLWDDELKRSKPSVLRLLLRGFGWHCIGGGLLYCVAEAVTRY